MTDQPRRSAGTPIGGQFAGHDRPEGDVNLTASAPSAAQRRLLAELARFDTVELSGPGPNATEWDQFLHCWVARDGVLDPKFRANEHAVQRLLAEGLLDIAAERDGSWQKDGRRSIQTLTLSSAGRAAIAGDVPKKPTTTQVALAWIATGKLSLSGVDSDSRTRVRTDTLYRLRTDGLVDEGPNWELTLTDAGRAALDQSPEAEQTAKVERATRDAHHGNIGPTTRSRAIRGNSWVHKRTASRCSCGWTHRSNEPKAEARRAHADHVNDEIKKALAAAGL